MSADDPSSVASPAAPVDPDLVVVRGKLSLNAVFSGTWRYSGSSVNNEFEYVYDEPSGQYRGHFKMQRNEKAMSRVSESVSLTVDGSTVTGQGTNRFGEFVLRGSLREDGDFSGFKEYTRLKLPPAPLSASRREEKRHREPTRRYESEDSDALATAALPQATRRPRHPHTAAASEDEPEPEPVGVYMDHEQQQREAAWLNLPTTGSERRQRSRKRLRDLVCSLQRRHFPFADPRDTRVGPPEVHPLFPFVKPILLDRPPKRLKLASAKPPRPSKPVVLLDAEHWGPLAARIRPHSTRLGSGSGLGSFCEAMVEPDGTVFQGELHKGLRNGVGAVVYPSGLMYCGEFKRGLEHGEGQLRDETGALIFRGSFEQGHMSGRGTFYYSDGYVYYGDVREGLRHGKGVTWAPDGAVYEGDYVFGMRSGHGHLVTQQGSYKGEWLNDQKHGKGVLKLANGTKLQGMFAHDQAEGRCVVKFPDGSQYEGNFREGLKDSRGTYTFANGSVYEGRFRQDQIQGTGTLKLVPGMSLEIASADADKHEWMTPIDVMLTQELRLVHLKAGFEVDGSF